METNPHVEPIRDASRRVVRELGFLRGTLAGTALPPSAVHALLEIAADGALTATELCERLVLEKSSVSRMLAKLVEAGDVTETATERDRRVKALSLTPQGRATLADIHTFARDQVVAALDHLEPEARDRVRDGLRSYAWALEAARTGRPRQDTAVVIEPGFRSGALGRVVEMHARTYARLAGFGRLFESRIAAGLAEFTAREDDPRSRLWLATRGGDVVGSVAIDGQDLGGGIAHLRWFIVDDQSRGSGIGRRLLSEAIRFCDHQDVLETQVWTFRGLDASRSLYEAHGFALVEERPGCQWGAEVLEQRFLRPRPAAACFAADVAGPPPSLHETKSANAPDQGRGRSQ